MPRWEPRAKERLESAALDLYESQGYEATTVEEIAQRSGVTSRTYFRYFPDKREVLFGNAEVLRERVANALRDAPAELTPLSACLHAIKDCEDVFQRRDHGYLRRRDAVIESAEELQEREARKLRSMAADLAAELNQRQVDPDAAPLVADLATTIFVHASRLWMHDPGAFFAPMVDRAAMSVQALFSTSE